jgi:hypothetical protein
MSEGSENVSGFEFEGVDRYGDGPRPDPATMCRGQCEGLGRYPQDIRDPSISEYERQQWELEEANDPTDDGVHFIVCGDCGGTGERKKTATTEPAPEQ